MDSDVELLDLLMGEYRQDAALNDFGKVKGDVERTLTAVGVAVDPRSPTYQRLANALLRAHVEVLRIARARRTGDYSTQPDDPLFRARSAVAPSGAVAAVEGAASSAPLSTILDLYSEARRRDKKWGALTARASMAKLRLFVETLGDPPVDTVTPDHIRDWRDALVDLCASSEHLGQMRA